MRSVAIIQRRMTGYRVPFFERLRRRLALSEIDVRVVSGHGTPQEEQRGDGGRLDWGVSVPTRYVRLGARFIARLGLRHGLLEGLALVVLPHENSLLPNSLPLLVRGSRACRLGLWGHASVVPAASGPNLFAGVRAWTARRADWWFAYTERSVDSLDRLGFPKERITCVNNAVDAEALGRWKSEVSDAERAALLGALGLAGDRLAVALCSLAAEKRLDRLFSVADAVRAEVPAFELVIVGDGPLRGFVGREAARRPWVRWVGRRDGREMALYASLGRLLLNPGMVGLAILDGFALGLPTVTVDAPIHSPEIAYLENGRNGLMVEDSVRALARATVDLLSDEGRRGRMAAECLKDAGRYSLDSMVERFADGVERALAAPPRRR